MYGVARLEENFVKFKEFSQVMEYRSSDTPPPPVKNRKISLYSGAG